MLLLKNYWQVWRERIGIEGSRIKHPSQKMALDFVLNKELPGTLYHFEAIAQLLTHPEFGVIESPDNIKAIGHRIVHGGEKFSKTQIITPEVKEKIKSAYPFDSASQPGQFGWC